MKASRHVAGPVLASAMLTLLTGCRQIQMQRCVDDHNVVVDDSLCENPHTPQPGKTALYRYYYGGASTYYPGSIATGGGYSPAPGQTYATSRGGFSQGRAARK
jgi:hypothetical protein